MSTLSPRAVRAAFAASLILAGCGQEPPPESISPAVEADSESGSRALDTDRRLRSLRQQQEAKARVKLRSLPDER